MKYAEIIITVCSMPNPSLASIGVTVAKINKDAVYVQLRLREKETVGYGEDFSIGHSYGYMFITNRGLSFKVMEADEVNQCESSMVPVNYEVNVPGIYRKSEIDNLLYKVISSLYYWDKRCQRSVRVKRKETTDIPLRITKDGVEVQIALEQMKTFANFIKNK